MGAIFNCSSNWEKNVRPRPAAGAPIFWPFFNNFHCRICYTICLLWIMFRVLWWVTMLKLEEIISSSHYHLISAKQLKCILFPRKMVLNRFYLGWLLCVWFSSWHWWLWKGKSQTRIECFWKLIFMEWIIISDLSRKARNRLIHALNGDSMGKKKAKRRTKKFALTSFSVGNRSISSWSLCRKTRNRLIHALNGNTTTKKNGKTRTKKFATS